MMNVPTSAPTRDSAGSSKERLTSEGSVCPLPPAMMVKIRNRTVMHTHPYLQANFYPVYEETEDPEGIDCEIVGVIPESLRHSQYVRTGPNSIHVPEHHGPHHFFDGDGMVHGVYFDGKEGSAIRPRYMNRFVRCEIFEQGLKHGLILFSVDLLMNTRISRLKALMQVTWLSLKSFFLRVSNMGNGNTALLFANQRLLALEEAGLPFELTVPALESVGEYNFEEDGIRRGKKPWLPNTEACTAHPKVCPRTGETILFNWRFLEKPFMFYSVITPDGKRRIWNAPIPGYSEPTMTHDFAITERHSILLQVPLIQNPATHLKRNIPILAFEEDKPAKFGVFPRYFDPKKDEVIWFESRTCHIFHTSQAWDEKDSEGNVVAVCMTGCRSNRLPCEITKWGKTDETTYRGGKTMEELTKKHIPPGSGDYDAQDPDSTYLTLFRFDLKTKETQMTTLTTLPTEFPVMNFDWYTRPNAKYIYSSTMTTSVNGVGWKSVGVIKLNVQAVLEKKKELMASGQMKNFGGDGQWELGLEALKELQEKEHKVYKFVSGVHNSEPFFVPALPRKDGKELEEDEGHLIMYVYDENQLENGHAQPGKPQVTELWIFDAQKFGPETEPVAKVRIPRRIPYGFHGLWLSKEMIKANQELNASRKQQKEQQQRK
ncbi:hypothetical protein BGZ93_008839 [Podila epicladia]|nr:hypothetical protein BGZ93_008839 [Podila epicladia]